MASDLITACMNCLLGKDLILFRAPRAFRGKVRLVIPQPHSQNEAFLFCINFIKEDFCHVPSLFPVSTMPRLQNKKRECHMGRCALALF